jgi:hypothetical protein
MSVTLPKSRQSQLAGVVSSCRPPRLGMSVLLASRWRLFVVPASGGLRLALAMSVSLIRIFDLNSVQLRSENWLMEA